MNTNTEQSSDIIAEDTLPKTVDTSLDEYITNLPLHVRHCIRLISHTKDQAPTVRCFYSIDGRVFLAVVLSETNDSFLVGAGARMVMNTDKVITSEPLSGEPILRLMKSFVSYVTLPSAKSRYYYYTYLINNGIMILPDYLTDEVISDLVKYVDQYKFENDLDVTESNSFRPATIPGASKNAFIPLQLNEKIH